MSGTGAAGAAGVGETEFAGFTEQVVDGIFVRTAGDGPPVLLLHGYPQTHEMWADVAPGLAAAGRSVVCADLRGYGRSHKPPAGEGNVSYAKRTMAAELVAVMATLGHERFAVVGHDRGGRVSYRMALDHPEVITRLATLDIVPTLDTWEAARGTAAVGMFHWSFLAQPHPLPETLIAADPGYFLRTLCGKWAAGSMARLERYVAAFTPDVVRATCDDYRAGATIDVELDRADRDGGRRIACPVLALWGDPSGKRPSLVDVWQRWADDVQGRAIRCGHFLAEEAPAETLAALDAFLDRA
ncbi:MAG: alpha/beta hydrolase [Acidimicrobiales bacterium]